jgi:ATP-binding cassette subfamily A (ABC1) protein 3
VELLEHYNDYFKLKVEKKAKSIGFLFGMIEGLKAECKISEYSVSQTTLEQIFQTFANLEVDEAKGMIFEKGDG